MTSRNDTIDLVGLQHFNVLPFFFRVMFAVTDDGLVAIFEELVFQFVNQLRIKDVTDVWKNKPNQLGRFSLEASSQIIGLVAQFSHGFINLLNGFLR